MDLDDRLLHLCRAKLENFTRVENSFKRFFNSDLLEDILNAKADQTMVDNLNRIKVNLSDLTITNDLI